MLKIFFFEKSNPRLYSFNTSKDIMILPCMAKIRGISLLTLTVLHPVFYRTGSRYSTRTTNRFSLKFAQKLWFLLRTCLHFILRTDFIEQSSAGFKLFIGSKVLCMFFLICTPDERGEQKVEDANFKTKHTNL